MHGIWPQIRALSTWLCAGSGLCCATGHIAHMYASAQVVNSVSHIYAGNLVCTCEKAVISACSTSQACDAPSLHLHSCGPVELARDERERPGLSGVGERTIASNDTRQGTK
jgi:hypothetical protein